MQFYLSTVFMLFCRLCSWLSTFHSFTQTLFFLTIQAMICSQLLHLLLLIKPVQNFQQLIWTPGTNSGEIPTLENDFKSRYHAIVKLSGHLGWIYSLLSRGWVNSSPTDPSIGVSLFSETGTNRDVSGGLGGLLLDETFLLHTTEPDWCCLCNKPDPNVTWQLPAVIRGLRLLMWRWSRENKRTHRFTDIFISPLFAPSVGYV